VEKVFFAINAQKIGTAKVIPAKRIPIVKYEDELTKMHCDINVNSLLGIVNSALLAAYARYDQRFHILGYLVKEWAKSNEIQGGDKGLLTSYAYLNMLIAYLQIIKPPILPNLQKLHLSNEPSKKFPIKYPVPEFIIQKQDKVAKYDDDEEFYNKEFQRNARMRMVTTDIYYERDLNKVKDFMQKEYSYNYSNIAELFTDFLRFYAYEFDSEKHMISIKEGKIIEKKEEDDFLFSIEDPFDLYHNPGKTVFRSSPEGKRVKEKFIKGYLSCLQGFRLQID